MLTMPLVGSYGAEPVLAGGCELYRLVPVVRRPRG
jgi:hypothetical protein